MCTLNYWLNFERLFISNQSPQNSGDFFLEILLHGVRRHHANREVTCFTKTTKFAPLPIPTLAVIPHPRA